jgi:shikimate kinase
LSSSEPGPGQPGRKCVVLVGMMGAGKSTVASVVARWLGWSRVDTDAVVEQRAGSSVAEIFARDGEEAFRAAESAAIAELRHIGRPVVVSVGGGAVLREANRRALRAAGTVVWLRASPATLAGRVGDGGGRPVLAGSGLGAGEALEKLVRERRPYYEEVADVVVDVDEISSEEAARLVMKALPGVLAGEAP